MTTITKKKSFKFGGTRFSFGSKLVKIQIGDETRYIKYAELWGMAFAMARDDETKDHLLPVRKENIMKFKKVHTVQLKNDMKAGETLQFSCIIDVPTHVIAGMRDMLEREVPGAVEALKEEIPELSPPVPLLPKA